MNVFKNSITTLFIFLLLISFTELFGQCPSAIIETKRKIFYKDVLNEYTQKPIKGGRYTVNTDNGELLIIEDKKFIKPSRIGKIRIAIKEDQGNGSTIQVFDYFDCETLPNPKAFAISNKLDTFAFENSMPISQYRTIQFLTTKSVVPSVSYKSTVENFTITIIGQKNKVATFKVKGSENLQTILKVNVGDKIIFSNIKIKIDGELESRVLDNRVIEIVE